MWTRTCERCSGTACAIGSTCATAAMAHWRRAAPRSGMRSISPPTSSRASSASPTRRNGRSRRPALVSLPASCRTHSQRRIGRPSSRCSSCSARAPDRVQLLAKNPRKRTLGVFNGARRRESHDPAAGARHGENAVEPSLDESLHAFRTATRELDLLVPADDVKAEIQEGASAPGLLRHGVNPELHLTRVDPLPDLVIHLTALQMAPQGPVGPAEHAHASLRDITDLVEDDAHAHPDPHAQPQVSDLEQHVPALERRISAVVRPNPSWVGEVVVADQTFCRLEGAGWNRLARRLRRQRPAVVVHVPGVPLDRGEGRGVEVELQILDSLELRRNVAPPGEPRGSERQASLSHRNAPASTFRVWISMPPLRFPPESLATRSSVDVHMWSCTSLLMRSRS